MHYLTDGVMGEYVIIKIPKELVDKMDVVIKNRLCGYRSRAEIASEGIRIIMSGVVNNQHHFKEGGENEDKEVGSA